MLNKRRPRLSAVFEARKINKRRGALSSKYGSEKSTRKLYDSYLIFTSKDEKLRLIQFSTRCVRTISCSASLSIAPSQTFTFAYV